MNGMMLVLTCPLNCDTMSGAAPPQPLAGAGPLADGDRAAIGGRLESSNVRLTIEL